MPQTSVMACTMEFADAIPDTTAAKPSFKSNLANVTHTPPPAGSFAQPDTAAKDSGRTKMAAELTGQRNQRANH